ncbi:MAG: OmpA family protein [Bacteroidota bacterium]
MKNLILFLFGLVTFSSCVSKKLFRQSQMETANLRSDSAMLANTISQLQGNVGELNSKVGDLNKTINNLNAKNNQLGQESATQQSQLNQTKLTLEQQQQRLQQLQALVQEQRNRSEQLKNKMMDALKGYNANDLSVVQKNGKVYVSLSENLLFPSGSAVINKKGVEALSKLAAVLNLNSEVAVEIEGHTDSIPIKGRYTDNWDLSTARSNSIVRILVNNYAVDPGRVMSSGHSFYEPVDTNSTADGRAKNRRTEIVLSPKLEEMYKLLE